MKKQNQRTIFLGFGCITAFILWTIAIRRIDVQAIGPQGSSVGFATLNSLIHSLTGVHMALYTITDWLGLVPFVFVLGFALLCFF